MHNKAKSKHNLTQKKVCTSNPSSKECVFDVLNGTEDDHTNLWTNIPSRGREDWDSSLFKAVGFIIGWALGNVIGCKDDFHRLV